jgi:hypothetical protein
MKSIALVLLLLTVLVQALLLQVADRAQDAILYQVTSFTASGYTSGCLEAKGSDCKQKGELWATEFIQAFKRL